MKTSSIMPSHKEHMNISLENLLKKHTKIFRLKKEKLISILDEMHYWFDYFMWKKSESDLESGRYDYTGAEVMKHREQRHHFQGIDEAVKLFSEKYCKDFSQDGFGDEFIKIIREEATMHVAKDYEGICQAPFSKEIYKELGFWRRIRGY